MNGARPAAANAIDGWSDYEEYGTPRDLATTNTIGGPLGYGCLGQEQRSTTDATAGLTLMGARLYNPTRGLFTTVDPVQGGNDSVYAYPTDPINQFDLDGKVWYRKRGGALVQVSPSHATKDSWSGNQRLRDASHDSEGVLEPRSLDINSDPSGV